MVGVLYHSRLSNAFIDPVYTLYLQGIAQILELTNVSLTLLPGATGEEASRRIGRSPVDGYIVYSMAPTDPLVEQVRQSRAPVVFIDQSPDPAHNFVGIKDRAGGLLAAQHLRALGHRNIGVISLEMDIGGLGTMTKAQRMRACALPMVAARLKGYAGGLRRSLMSAGIRVYESKGSRIEEGRRGFQEIVSEQPRTTAILAMSDLLAMGAIEAAKEKGLRVPEDLSVVGFDDIPASKTVDPPLTTIQQPHVEKGRAAAQMLLALIEKGGPRKPRVFPVKLVARESTSRMSGAPRMTSD